MYSQTLKSGRTACWGLRATVRGANVDAANVLSTNCVDSIGGPA